MARNHVLFTSLSRRKRRSATLKIKNLIYKERAVWGGVFYDECEHDAAVASGGWTWSDIVFLGRDPAVFWNAEIITANVAFRDEIEEAAFNEALLRLDAASQRQAMHLDFIPDINRDGKTISYTWGRKPQRNDSQLEGLSISDFADKRAREIARTNPPPVYCGYRILPGYAAGIGLKMVVDAEVLSRSVIESAIADFLARGEQNWFSDVPALVHYIDNIYCKPLNEAS